MWIYKPQPHSQPHPILWLNLSHWSNSPTRFQYPLTPDYYWHYSPLRKPYLSDAGGEVVCVNQFPQFATYEYMNYQPFYQQSEESFDNVRYAQRYWGENSHSTNPVSPKYGNGNYPTFPNFYNDQTGYTAHPEMPIWNQVSLDMADLARRVYSTNGIRLLIVLDIQGSILMRLSRQDITVKYWKDEMQKHNFVYNRDMQYIWLRPHFREFFKLLTRRHATAFWCSCTDKNVSPTIKHVSKMVDLPGAPSFESRMEFIWGRSHTDKDPRPGRQSYQRIKNPNEIWRKLRYSEYSTKNTLMVEDTASTTNSAKDSTIVIPYYNCMKRIQSFQSVDDTLMWLILYIEYLVMMAEKKTDPIDITAIRSGSLDFTTFCQYGQAAAEPLVSKTDANNAKSTARALLETYAPKDYKLDEKDFLKRLNKTGGALSNYDGSILMEFQR